MKSKIAVLGGGSWGATVASHMAKQGHKVVLWEFVESQVKFMKEKRTLPFMTLLKIPPAMDIKADMAAALSGADIVYSADPYQHDMETW